MSDLAATNCGCGCDAPASGCGNNMIWIILLLCCCGGYGHNGGGCGCGNGCDNSCIWIILLLCCCADGEMDAVSAADRTGISRDCGAANGRPFCSFSLYFLLSEACFLFFSSRTPHRSRRQHFHL